VTHIGGGELDLDNPQFVASASVSLHEHMLRLLAAAEAQ
jgi:hypothetical protein